MLALDILLETPFQWHLSALEKKDGYYQMDISDGFYDLVPNKNFSFVRPSITGDTVYVAESKGIMTRQKNPTDISFSEIFSIFSDYLVFDGVTSLPIFQGFGSLLVMSHTLATTPIRIWIIYFANLKVST